MPLLNDMKNEDQAARTSAENSELLRELTTRQSCVEEHVAGLTAAINKLVEKQSSDMRSLSGRLTVMEQQRPGTPPPSNAASEIGPVRQRLDEIEKTLSVLADSVSGNDLRSATKALSAETKGITSASKQAAADAQRHVQPERTGRNDLQVVVHLRLVHAHDRALAELLFDLGQCGRKGFLLVGFGHDGISPVGRVRRGLSHSHRLPVQVGGQRFHTRIRPISSGATTRHMACIATATPAGNASCPRISGHTFQPANRAVPMPPTGSRMLLAV